MSLRELKLGPKLSLVFEDRQIIHGGPDAGTLVTRSEPRHRLAPIGEGLIASLCLQRHKVQADGPEPTCPAQLEHHVYAEVEGHGRSFAKLESSPDRGADDPTSPRHLLRFELSPAQIAALRAGADFGFGIDDDRMRVGAMVKREMRVALLADLE